jgi:hypothetical protein
MNDPRSRDEQRTHGIENSRWRRGERFLREVLRNGGELTWEAATEAARIAHYPNGNFGGFLHGDGDLRRVGNNVQITKIGMRDYVIAVDVILGQRTSAEELDTNSPVKSW